VRTLPLWQVDAFTDRVFGGNPAAVVVLEDEWLSDETLKAIAAENNLSETAFLLKNRNPIPLRWFTPRMEVPLCGHATLAAALVLTECVEPVAEDGALAFETRSGTLVVARQARKYILDFPAVELKPSRDSQLLSAVLGVEVLELFETADRYICVLEEEATVAGLSPDSTKIRALRLPGLVVTALAGDDTFVSRYFAPAKGVEEDPVTGTSHCALAPFWGGRLRKSILVGRQLSQRGGAIRCEVRSGRVLLEGEGRLVLRGEIYLPA